MATTNGRQLAETTEYGVPRSTPAAGTLQPAYGYLGTKQRDTSTPGGLALMGVRLYTPTLGRFLTTDPVEGGSANNYDYVGQDPINTFDLDGNCWRHCHWAGLRWHGARAAINAPSTAIGIGYAYARGGRCSRSSGLSVNCQGVGGANGSGGFTFGNAWLHKQRNRDYDPHDLRGLMRHEHRHSDQYALFGGFLGFPALYGIDRAVHHNPRKSWFERWGGLRDGNY